MLAVQLQTFYTKTTFHNRKISRTYLAFSASHTMNTRASKTLLKFTAIYASPKLNPFEDVCYEVSAAVKEKTRVLRTFPK